MIQDCSLSSELEDVCRNMHSRAFYATSHVLFSIVALGKSFFIINFSTIYVHSYIILSVPYFTALKMGKNYRK